MDWLINVCILAVVPWSLPSNFKNRSAINFQWPRCQAGSDGIQYSLPSSFSWQQTLYWSKSHSRHVIWTLKYLVKESDGSPSGLPQSHPIKQKQPLRSRNVCTVNCMLSKCAALERLCVQAFLGRQLNHFLLYFLLVRQTLCRVDMCIRCQTYEKMN